MSLGIVLGGLPNDVRTHYTHSGDKESVLLAKYLLTKRFHDQHSNPNIFNHLV